MARTGSDQPDTRVAEAPSPALRALLVAAGSIAVGLGVLGLFVPLLPTTPFLLIAAACYVRSSPRLHTWLRSNRVLGGYLRAYHDGVGMPLRTKVATLLLLWVTVGSSALFFTSTWWARALLAAVAVGVTVHLLRLPTAPATSKPIPADAPRRGA